MQLSHWQLLQVLAVCFRSGAGGGLDTTPLQHTAATTRLRIPVTMDRRPTPVSMVVAALWLHCQVAAAVQHQFMRRVTDHMVLVAATIPAAIRADHQDVLQDRALERNPLVR